MTDHISVSRELLANFVEYSDVHKDGVRELWEVDKQKLMALLYPQPVGQNPIARVTGQFAGRAVIEPADRSTVLPTGMALYARQDLPS